MAEDRRKEIARHLSEDDLDRLLDETDDEKISKRLTFVKRLYKGATLEDAADDVGRSSATATRWVRRWNEGGLGLLTPNFGGGRPPKLDEDEQDELIERLRDGQPWKSQEVQHLLLDEFDVEYHPNYLGTFLRDLGLSMRNRGQSVHISQRIQTRFSKSASMTRSTRTSSHTTNVRVMTIWLDDEESLQTKVFFRLHPDENVTSHLIRDFLHQVRLQLDGQMTVLWDRASVHTANRIERFFETHDRFAEIRIPTCCPELNPCEGVWDWSKITDMGNVTPQTFDDLIARTRSSLTKLHIGIMYIDGVIINPRLTY